MAGPRKKGLGKGLDALFEDNHVEDKAITQLKISQIEPNASQPRDHFDEAALRELADSIRAHGVLQPLVVRPLENNNYQIVAGERRWRASRIAGISEIPVIIKDLTDAETLEIGIIENLQREDLNPVELARGYRSLMEEYSMTQEQVAERVGKSRPVVANTVRLLKLPEEVLDLIVAGEITTGHARALLGLEDDRLIIEIAKKTAGENLLVRDIERLSKASKQGSKRFQNNHSSRPNTGWGNSFYKEIELALSSELGRKVEIKENGKKATLSLEFYSKNELENFVQRVIQSLLENKGAK